MRLWSVDEAVASIAVAAREGDDPLVAGAEAALRLSGALVSRATLTAGGDVASHTRWRVEPKDAEGAWTTHEAAAGPGTNLAVEVQKPIETTGLGALTIALGMAIERVRLARETESTRSIYRTLVEQLPAVTYYRAIDEPGIVAYISPQVEGIFGFSQQDFVKEPDLWKRRLHPDDAASVLEQQMLARPERTGSPVRAEYRLVRRDGSIIWVENHAHTVSDLNGRVRFVLGVIFDVTERKQLEAELARAHKLEAIGKLAGSVAHEFNNLMTIVTGRGQALSMALTDQDPSQHDLREIIRAGERAAVLTRQLLALGRRQTMAPSVVDPAELVRDARQFLSSSLGPRIELHLETSRSTRHVKVDVKTVEQILLNLAMNAREAMPGGGSWRIEVADCDLTSTESIRYARLAPGRYVALSLVDSGSGVPSVVEARIFEPFFTTKDATIHSGLGLATSLGMAEQSGGTLFFDRTAEPGARFTLLLPATDEQPKRTPRPSQGRPRPRGDAVGPKGPATVPDGRASGGSPSVLLVDDDEQVRSLVATMLERLGYGVKTAASGAEALSLAAEGGEIAALVTDIAMPGMDGFELAERLRASRDALTIVFMSGYHDDSAAHRGRTIPGTVLPKPFSMAELGRHLAASLASQIVKAE